MLEELPSPVTKVTTGYEASKFGLFLSFATFLVFAIQD